MPEKEPTVETYEAEIKIELTEEERARLITKLHELGFTAKEPVPQKDIYIEGKKSPYGGYDLKRYRDEGGVFTYNEKVWETVGDKKVRREEERGVPKAEFEDAAKNYPNAVTISKERVEFAGEHEGRKIKIDLDSVKFDHSPAVRFFVEAETLTENKDEAPALKEAMRKFLEEMLGTSGLIEAPGMFTMAFEKK